MSSVFNGDLAVKLIPVNELLKKWFKKIQTPASMIFFSFLQTVHHSFNRFHLIIQ